MKKVSITLIILMLVMSIHYTALNESRNDAMLNTDFDSFVGNWSTDGASAEIRFSGGYYQVRIEIFDHGDEMTEWTYMCVYDENKHILEDTNMGKKTNYVYEFTSNEEIKTINYQDGNAVFLISDEGYLIWIDGKENAGENLFFQKIGNYSGIWHCGNTSIDFYAIGNSYRCIVTREEDAITTIKWVYYCRYDLGSGNAICDHDGNKEIIYAYNSEEEESKEIYADGSAVFSIDDDGNLTWKDLEENAGEGLLFIKTTVD